MARVSHATQQLLAVGKNAQLHNQLLLFWLSHAARLLV
jgi:hypothetical protein